MIKAVKKIVKNFKTNTGMKLKYVMLPTGASQKVIKAFNKNKVTVISKTQKVTKVKNVKVEEFNGVVVLETKSVTKKDLNNLKKALKSSSVSGISLKECIPSKSVSGKDNNASETDANTTDAENVIKSAAIKASETDAESEVETEANTAANTESTKPAEVINLSDTGAASSVAFSSIMSVAAIAAVAVFLL